jgi:hypothetical protein
MDFRIGSKQLGLGSPFLKEAPREPSLRLKAKTALDPGQLEIRGVIEDAKPPENPSLEEAKAPNTVYGLSLTKTVVSLAQEAASAIADIRDQQVAYADEARSISDPERQDALNTEIGNLQTEITRIASQTVINGKNVFQNNALSIQKYPPELLNEVINVPDASTIATDPGVSVINQTNAAGAYTILSSAAQAAHDAADKVQDIEDKLSEVSVDTKPPDKLDSVEDAQKLASKIVDDIYSRISKHNPVSDILINNLDPNRVQSLLS